MKMYQLIALAENEKLPISPPDDDFAEQALLQNFRAMPPKERELFLAMGERLAQHT